jgi:hypothetical protein
MQFKVVDPADFFGEPDPEDWTNVVAITPEDAAETFCDCSDRENRYEYLKADGGQVLVKDGNGRVFSITVRAHTKNFYNAIKSVEKLGP